MNNVGADDFIEAKGATAEDLDGLPRGEILPPLIHLVDLERTEYVGRIVRTDIVIAGVGETFHVPRSWEAKCIKGNCPRCPTTVDLKTRKDLLNFCRMSDDQTKGFMRAISGCKNKPTIREREMTTITEILALPVATPNVEGSTRDYREKIVYLVGSLSTSNIRYRAIGTVIAEPKRQRAALLITRLDRLQSASEEFTLTSELSEQFRTFQMTRPADSSPQAQLDAAEEHVKRVTRDITKHITKIYGSHRETVLLGELLTLHSPAEIHWAGEIIKGVVDGLVVGDTGQGKTTQARRLIAATGLGYLPSGSTGSRTGLLYNLDSKVNDKRILRWGAFPLAHGEILFVDEAQNISRKEWTEFTSARSEGILKVDRSIRAEHPSRVRLVCFANPLEQRSMASFQYGIMAVHPESGFLDSQDLRRFDFVALVSEADQETNDIVSGINGNDTFELIPPNLLRESILWAWTRRIEHLR
ncbi:MAG: hypothetical protein O7B35_09340, partial [Deltaproteobacteria bacterium]|nr:hypothetical protein [Deltaproteobacteria bacterium]